MEFICSLTLTEYYPNDVPQTCANICPHPPPTRKNGCFIYKFILTLQTFDIICRSNLFRITKPLLKGDYFIQILIIILALRLFPNSRLSDCRFPE